MGADRDCARHSALLVSADADLTAAGASWVRAGHELGQPVVAVLTPDVAAALAPGTTDGTVVWADWSEVFAGGAPAAVTALRRLAARHRVGEDGVVRLLIEPWAGTDPDAWREWQRFEAVLDHVAGSEPLCVACVHDTRRQPAQLVDTARATHPVLLQAEGEVANADHQDPAAFLTALPVPAEPLEGEAPLVSADSVRDLRGLRHDLSVRTSANGLLAGHETTVEDFLLAVDEMTTNALRHGRPPVDLRLWATADRLVCRVTDHGSGLDDPFIGYGPAHGEDLSRGGMGLWLARQLCDHVDITPEGDGVSIRLTTSLD